MEVGSIYKIIEMAYSVPGVKIDRDEFLRDCFADAAYEVKKKIVETSPIRAGIQKEKLDELARKHISNELLRVTALSAGAGGVNIGGIGTAVAAGTTDMIQYFGHSLRLCQKLAYIYGWPDFSNPTDLFLKIEDDNVRIAETILLGCMFGVAKANEFVMELSVKTIAKYSGIRGFWTMISPPIWYNVASQVGKVLGVNISREFAKRTVTKVVPVLGAVASGGITYLTFKNASENLYKVLRENPIR